jgi:membrane-bound lytic murein transglycosylase D
MFKYPPALPGFLACFAFCLFSTVAAASEAGVPPGSASAPAVVNGPGSEPAIDPDPIIELPEDSPPLATIDLTLPPDDLWDRIRNGYGMPDIDSPIVQQQQAWYLAHPDYLRRVAERSRRYMHHIVVELEKRGMPTELALLPIVESAYNPMAYSRSHASGMWQFIPSTGKTYQLDQNWWMDQRRDIIASTSAALEYLQSIYDMHGDWHLALASYNWGENAVARAIEKNRAEDLPTDYLSLSMPEETRLYVPKLQALKNIVARPELFNFSLDPIPNKPYFRTVEVSAHMDVAIAARLAEMTVEEFLALNPAYNRPVIPDKEGVSIVLPSEQVDTFVSNLESHDKPLTNWQAYTLRKGENLKGVAKKHGLTLARLRQINGINARMRIRPGHTLLVPAKGNSATDDLLSVNLPVAKPKIRKKRYAKRGKKGATKGGRKAVSAKKTSSTAKKKPARKQAKQKK